MKVISDSYHLYIGIPFCSTKCSFCHYIDNIKFGHTFVNESYMNILLKQLQKVLELNKSKTLQSVYLGGGTPSLLSCSQLLEIKNLINRYHKPIEVTIEIYPTNWDKLYLDLDFITRYSIGVQSINKNTLIEYKRKDYNWTDILKILEDIKNYSQKLNINLDFLFDEIIDSNDINEINNISVDSIVFYPNTKGRGRKRLNNVYRMLEMINGNLNNYNNLYKSKHIFISKNQSIFSHYAKNEYEIFDDIIGIGSNSISSIGDESFVCLYDKGKYFYKKRHAKRYLISLIESSTTAMRLDKIKKIDKEFLKFTNDFKNIYYISENKYMQFYEFLLEKYSINEAETLLSIIGYGDSKTSCSHFQ